MPAGVRRVRGRALSGRHGEKEGLLAVWVLPHIVRLHPGEQILRESIGETFNTRTELSAGHHTGSERDGGSSSFTIRCSMSSRL